MSRATLLAQREQAEAALEADALTAPDGEETSAPGVVLATAVRRLRCTAVRRGDVRQVDVWVSSVGVVAMPRGADDDEPVPLVALPPSAAYVVLASVLDLPVGSPASVGPSTATGLDELSTAAMGGGAGAPQEVRVIDELDDAGSVLRRGVVVDADGGRSACLAAPLDRNTAIELAPLSPWRLLEELTALVDVTGPEEPRVPVAGS